MGKRGRSRSWSEASRRRRRRRRSDSPRERTRRRRDRDCGNGQPDRDARCPPEHGRRREEGRDSTAPVAEEAPPANWMADLGADGDDSGGSEDSTERLLAESRRRREAIRKKHGVAEQPAPPAADHPPPAAAAREKPKPQEPARAAQPEQDPPRPAAAAAFDMFGDGDAAVPALRDDINMSERMEEGRDDIAVGQRATDEYTDRAGYYTFKNGEVLAARYQIQGRFGGGVFSVVLRAQDTAESRAPDRPETVALKVLRNVEAMRKTGLKEIETLKLLQSKDPHNRKHCVRLYDSFIHRGHVCLVLEPMESNLREVLKRYGKDAGRVVGLSLGACHSYVKQLAICLRHMHSCDVLHADFKPDNILVSNNLRTIKLGDFGSAMLSHEMEITPYLVSRYYRAPEIMLGLPYSHPMDVWSLGVVAYELFTGKIMFLGDTNNAMLHLIQEVRGQFAKRMIRKAELKDRHFNDELVFMRRDSDPVTKKPIVRPQVYITPVRSIKMLVERASLGIYTTPEDKQSVRHLWDLIEKCLTLDPACRITAESMMQHPFVTREGGEDAAKGHRLM